MTTFADLVYQLGGLPAGLALVPPGGAWLWVDPANGGDGNDGLTPGTALATVGAAYAKCTANRNDVVALIGGPTASVEAAAIDWAKNYTHLLGFCAPVHEGQRARITQLSTLTGASPFFKVSASGCMFRNLRIWQGVADATSLINVQVTGERDHFYGVDFAGGGHATQAVDGGASLSISGAAECLFERCTIGVDTIAAATGMAGLVFAATGGATRNVWRDCLFSLYAGHAAAIFVELLGNAGIDRYQLFERCTFANLSATAMTQAFAVASGFDANNKRVLLKDCALIGATDWARTTAASCT